MANDFTNTAEHYIPVLAFRDKLTYTQEYVNIPTRLAQGLRGLAAYDSNGTNYVLASTNAGAILSSAGAAPRGRVIGAASGQDPQLSFQLNTGAALATAWTFGVDDSDGDKLKIEYAATLGGSAPPITITSTGRVAIGSPTTTTLDTNRLEIVASTAGSADGIWHQAQTVISDSAAQAVGVGGTLLFQATYNDADASLAGMAAIRSSKISAVSGQYAGNLELYARDGAILFLSQMNLARGSNKESARITLAGDFLLGTVTSPASGSGKVLVLGDNAGEPVLGTNTAAFYAADVSGTVEAFAVDEAGNQVQITTHHETTGEFIHRSRNRFRGMETVALLEQMAKDLSGITGKRYWIETPLPVEQCLDWDAVQADQRARREQEIAAWDASAAPTTARPEPYVTKAPPTYIAAAIKGATL